MQEDPKSARARSEPPSTCRRAAEAADRTSRQRRVIGAAVVVGLVGLIAVAIYATMSGRPGPRGARRDTGAVPARPDALRTSPEGGAQLADLAGLHVAPSLGDPLAEAALDAIQSGVRWLQENQHGDGHWSDASFPAMTGLAVSAILRSPGALPGEHPRAASQGLRFIVSCAREDGGIYRHVLGVKGGGLPNYNTAICLIALADANRPAYDAFIGSARDFLIRSQHRGGDLFRGGMGYDADTGRAYADMSNTYFALEALRRVESAERGESELRFDWEAAIGFVSRCQHLRAFNNAAWVRETPDEKGGFVYTPVRTVAELGTPESTGSTLPAYGSATYAGVWSYLNAGLTPESPGVSAALRWCARRWTVEENPRLGQQSLYYYYLAMAKALDGVGCDVLDTPRGQVRWRPALVERLVSLQRVDPSTSFGYWQNDSGRWSEDDPSLATSYALLALETAVFGHGGSREQHAE